MFDCIHWLSLLTTGPLLKYYRQMKYKYKESIYWYLATLWGSVTAGDAPLPQPACWGRPAGWPTRWTAWTLRTSGIFFCRNGSICECVYCSEVYGEDGEKDGQNTDKKAEIWVGINIRIYWKLWDIFLVNIWTLLPFLILLIYLSAFFKCQLLLN